MQLSSDAQIPDGLLAANALLREKPHQGVPSWNLAPHQGIDERNSTAAIGIRASAQLNRIWPRYTGKERDAESGNDYFGARYYASSMGRWMSPDWASNPVTIPFGNIADPQSLNLYSYVGNNPMNRFDPYGHVQCPDGKGQDVVCAVQTALQWIGSLFKGGGGGGGGGGCTGTCVSQPESLPQGFSTHQIFNSPYFPRSFSVNLGVSGEAGLGAGVAGTAQGSLAYDFQTHYWYPTGTAGGTYPGLDGNQSPNPSDWVSSLYAGGGFSFSLSNGNVDDLDGSSHSIKGSAHTINAGGRFLPYGLGVSYSYTGTPWKPGVYQITVAPPYVNWGAGAQLSHFDTNTAVGDHF